MLKEFRCGNPLWILSWSTPSPAALSRFGRPCAYWAGRWGTG